MDKSQCIQNNQENTKKEYHAPDINVVKIDKEICLVMMTYVGPGGGDDGGDPGDPNSSIQPEKFGYNPFKLPTT